jgi:hypothetical protein
MKRLSGMNKVKGEKKALGKYFPMVDRIYKELERKNEPCGNCNRPIPKGSRRLMAAYHSKYAVHTAKNSQEEKRVASFYRLCEQCNEAMQLYGDDATAFLNNDHEGIIKDFATEDCQEYLRKNLN